MAEPRTCRFCLEPAGAERLCSPCVCRGGSQYIHASCAEAFYISRGEANAASWCDLKCPTCHQSYAEPVGTRLGRVGLARVQQAAGPDSTPFAVMQSALATALLQCGGNEESRDLLKNSLRILERDLGRQHTDVAMTLLHLGRAEERLGSRRRAGRLYTRALAIQQRALGDEDPKLATTLYALGGNRLALGDARGARRCLERAVAIKEAADTVPDGVWLSTLGNVLSSLGQPHLAREWLEKSVALLTQKYGTSHPCLVRTLNNLGTVLTELRAYTEAIAVYERAAALRPPDLAGVIHMAEACNGAGDHGRARDLLQRLLKDIGEGKRVDKLQTIQSTAVVRSEYAKSLHALGCTRMAVENMARAAPHMPRRKRLQRQHAREATILLAEWRGEAELRLRSRSPRKA